MLNPSGGVTRDDRVLFLDFSYRFRGDGHIFGVLHAALMRGEPADSDEREYE